MNPKNHSLLIKDKKMLEQTALPIITVSASFKEDLKGFHQDRENDRLRDMVFSRAHYSMALGAAVEAWGEKIDPKKAWLVDPTNHVSEKEWSSIQLTDLIGRTIARFPILKTAKDLVDKFGRSKLPILDSIAPATKFLCQNIDRPILSFHIATGNILAENGKEVIEMITDPHVRADYVINAARPNMRFLVFDEATKKEFFEVALKEGIKIPKDQLKDKVIVTGPPVDPRIINSAKKKTAWTQKSDRPLRILISTGGLGTNKVEIKTILNQLLPELKKNKNLPDFELLYYAGTHRDHQQMAVKLAKKYHVRHQTINPRDPADFENAGKLDEKAFLQHQAGRAKFRIIYHPQIIDANELLIRHGFPWADVFMSKPSGDMAYDAALSGAALLTLKEWGEWEHNVRQVFEKHGVAQKAEGDKIVLQLQNLIANDWVAEAMANSKKLPAIFYQGMKNIVAAAG